MHRPRKEPALEALLCAGFVLLVATPVSATPVTFEVEVPHCTPAGATIMLRSNRLDPASFRHDALTRIGPTRYAGTFEVAVDTSAFRYKYAHGICDATACPGIEKTLDFTGTGGDIPDRTLGAAATTVEDRVIIWRSAVTRVDAAGQVIGVRPDAEQVAFCGPYLSVNGVDGSYAVGYDAYDAGEVVLELGEDPSYGTRLVRSGSHRNHFSLPELTAGASYHYRIVEDGVPGADHVFRAPPESGQPFRFAFLGDAQYYEEQQRADHEQAVSLTRDFGPDLVLSPGDLVASEPGATGPGGWSYPEMGRWNVFFGTAADLMSEAPFMAAMGNHEEDAPYFWDVFAFPEPDAPAIDHYAFRFGNVHVTVLYTGSTDGYDLGGILDSQTRWMERTLEDASLDPAVRFKVVVLHRGPLSEGARHTTDGTAFWETDDGSRPTWRVLWERHAVDLVLAGHNHNFTLGELGGVRYITSCAGAPVHELRPDPLETTIHAEALCTADLFTVRGRTLSFEALRLDGSAIEEAAFTLCRSAADCDELDDPCPEAVAWRCDDGTCTSECVSGPPDAGPGDGGAADGGAPPTDSGALPDAAPTAADASTVPPPPGGCDCRAAGGRPATGLPLALLISVAWWRRRRGRGRST